ncbi:Metallo-beta-lactamase superfamily protein [Mariprofundus ferrinatatus]|uniref:Metallo-beta-lactamase superfamily protein n=1 Tax=Mariprofundus ferrinatatus TaxID=1921087 RepID=A0A2K8LC76_9PROT|nr:MBL fold metallo-hydrolase [Mariprofundus ferrinatatus]ATX81876.1 Metallo-beta-lactamase superfamily protein [Mariprofundus ferrinatatus]
MRGNLFVDTGIDMMKPTLLYQQDGHSIYWLGITDDTAFRCNAYLIVDGEEAIIVDPGSRSYFEQIKSRVQQIMNPESVSGMILCHQDPDVAASMVDWLALNPKAKVFTSPRTMVLLPHYGEMEFTAFDIEENPRYQLSSGMALRFITAPFLHSPAAFVTYSESARFLFSGDIWAALTTDWNLVTQDFEKHALNMDLFHIDYMASNIAAKGFVNKIADLPIDAILPQHGSIIAGEHVPAALDYLRTLRCGTDIAYPELG